MLSVGPNHRCRTKGGSSFICATTAHIALSKLKATPPVQYFHLCNYYFRATPCHVVCKGRHQMARKPTDLVPTMLRMEENLRKRLERAAKKNRQALNSEMVERLALSLEPPASTAPIRQRDDLAAGLLGSDAAAALLEILAFALRTTLWPDDQPVRLQLADE